jgi:hypothetical protein
MTVRIPKYRLHKGSGQALVEIDGRRIYLGKHDLTPSNEPMRGARILALGATEGVESYGTREEVCGGADYRQAA